MSLFTFIDRKAGRNLLLALPVAFLAAGCETIYNDIDDVYVPATHYERHPIGVTKTPVNVGVAAKHGRLGPRQETEVANVARKAAYSSSKVYVRRPSAGGRSEAVASEINYVLEANGVARRRIVNTTYPAGAAEPVLISFTTRGTTVAECGDWSGDVGVTYKNDLDQYPNFGCAHQNNIAAMMANPEDYNTPQRMTPSDPMRRSKIVDNYRTGEATAAAQEQQQQVAISSVAQ